jgi:hypothetical protein
VPKYSECQRDMARTLVANVIAAAPLKAVYRRRGSLRPGRDGLRRQTREYRTCPGRTRYRGAHISRLTSGYAACKAVAARFRPTPGEENEVGGVRHRRS